MASLIWKLRSISKLSRNPNYPYYVRSFQFIRNGSNKCFESLYNIGQPQLDEDYILDKNNESIIHENILRRKGNGNIKLINEIHRQYLNNKDLTVNIQLIDELRKIPNHTHPGVQSLSEHPRELCEYNGDKSLDMEKVYDFADICKHLQLFRMEHLGNFTGHKSYYLLDDLAELEKALIQYAVDYLQQRDFKLISVPDILPSEVIEGCGMNTTGDRNQVYKLSSSNLCLSGTSEMAIAGFCAGQQYSYSELPMKYVAVSRCFRAETSSQHEERGIYRVHHFTKVEMFAVCDGNQSDNMLEQFKDMEIELFNNLGLRFKILDMPPCELGAPAYRKYDIEAWMPGRGIYGEISSCSNCTDYQARRLNIRAIDCNGKNGFAHTVNGTACAIPRLLIAILEQNQKSDGTIDIPIVLQPKMNDQTKLVKKRNIPAVKVVKSLPPETL